METKQGSSPWVSWGVDRGEFSGEGVDGVALNDACGSGGGGDGESGVEEFLVGRDGEEAGLGGGWGGHTGGGEGAFGEVEFEEGDAGVAVVADVDPELLG